MTKHGFLPTVYGPYVQVVQGLIPSNSSPFALFGQFVSRASAY
jgi:hypothetical protein